jgi:hypothetical protein
MAPMPYVQRDASGAIASLHRQANETAPDFLPDEHPEVQAFVGRDAFARLDADFVRVLEDVIDTLISKNVVNITDLPAEAQVKLFSRKSFRERQGGNSLRLFGDADLHELVSRPDDKAG